MIHLKAKANWRKFNHPIGWQGFRLLTTSTL